MVGKVNKIALRASHNKLRQFGKPLSEKMREKLAKNSTYGKTKPFANPKEKTREGALALSRTVLSGQIDPDCPIPFSYVNAAQWLAEYVTKELERLYPERN